MNKSKRLYACYVIIHLAGGIPKWLKGAVSKTARRVTPCLGSNPSSSAKQNKKRTTKGGSYYKANVFDKTVNTI